MKEPVDVLIVKLADKLKDGREDHLEEVRAMERALKNAYLRSNLADHPALKELVSMIKKREQSFTTLLSNKEDATQEERMSWFMRRKECRFFLRFFESADSVIEGIRQQVEYQLSDDVDSPKQ